MTFYSLMIVTCLSAPVCFYESGDSYGLLLSGERDCRQAAYRISESHALRTGSERYEFRFQCNPPGRDAEWIEVSVGGSANGLTKAGG